MFESFNEFINEAKRGTIHKAVKAGDYPATIVVIENGKVIHQETVSTPEAVPASFNVLQKEYPKAKLHVEDKGGQTLFTEGEEIEEAYDGNMSDFKYEFPQTFVDVTGNPEKAIKKMAKAGKGKFEVRTSTYMSEPEMKEVADAMGMELVSYEKHSNIAISVFESLTEGYGEWNIAKNLTDIVNMSKDNKRAVFYVTDDNNSRIGTFYLKNGKFAKATTANASYDLQNSKTTLRDRNDVIYKYKVDESVVTEAKEFPTKEKLVAYMVKHGHNKEMAQEVIDANYEYVKKQYKNAGLPKISDVLWTLESVVTEAKSIAKIQKEWSKVTAIMKDTVAKWKEAEGSEKEDLKDELKTLTISKKRLEAELDDAVGLKDIDAELAEARDFNDPILMKMRAAKMKANKKAEPAKKELSPAKAKKLAKLQAQRAEIMRDMEQEAEMEGGEVADRYGDMLNKLDKQIAKLAESAVTETEEILEGKVQLKRRYTENHPAITAGKTARIRNKMLEAVADGKITQEEFNAILKEMSADSARWTRRNAKYFNVSEDGISLSKFGRRALSQVTVNEVEDTEITESIRVGKVVAIKKYNPMKNRYELMDVRITDYIKKPGSKDFVEYDLKGKKRKMAFDQFKKLMETNITENMNNNFIYESFEAFVSESLNENKYASAGKLGYNDQFLNRKMSLAKTLSNELGLTKEFVGPFLGFDYVSLYAIGPNNIGGTIIDDALTGKYTYDDLKAAAIEYLKDKKVAIKESTVNEESLNEAFKSSKLRSLVNLNNSIGYHKGYAGALAKAFYKMSKIKMDQIEDVDLLDSDPTAAYKEFRKSKDHVIFFIVDNEKENPYADARALDDLVKPGIIGMSRANEFVSPEIGGNKEYKGYGASGIYSVKRAADLADRAIVINMPLIQAVRGNANDDIRARVDAKSGATAFKSDREFKKANMERYKEILATKASKLPLDKMVEGAIAELSSQIAAGIKSNAMTKYGNIKIGESPKGRDVSMRDASHHMSNILTDYERYIDYMNQAEKEKESGFSSNYYEKESQRYAKEVSDSIKKIKSFDYAW